MKFLLVSHTSPVLGGVETLLVRVSRWLVKNGHQVCLLVDNGDNWVELLPNEVQRVVLRERFAKLYYYYHAKWLWESLGWPKPDVIKGFDFGSSWIATQFGAILGRDCKVIVGMYGPAAFKWYYAPDSLRPWNSAKIILGNYLDNIPATARVFCGVDQTEELQEVHGGKGILWPIPLDTTDFDPALRRPKFGKIVSVGRLSPMKEYNLYMIDVVKTLLDMGHDVTWSVYGAGEYERTMRERIKKARLEKYIFMEGTVPYAQFRKVLEDAYIFVGMGTSILEAAMFKVPNVSANAYDREGLTCGSVYNYPFGSIGSGMEPPKLKVIDEIERILRLSPEDYREEAERVGAHVKIHEMDKSMDFFLQVVRDAEPVRYRRSLFLVNYPLWLVRRVVSTVVQTRDRGHPEVSQLLSNSKSKS